MSVLKALLVSLVSTLGIAAPAAAAAAELRMALELQGDAARGKAGFETCVGCHRPNASGRSDGAIPRLSGQHRQVIVKQVADIRDGRRLNPPMKPFVDAPAFDAQLLADVAAYLQALPIVGNIGRGPGTALARGQELYARDCAACHGAKGEGLATAFHPMVAAQHYSYLLRELGLIRDGGRGNSNPEMVLLIKGYTQADLEAVADHMARLPSPARP
jgi:cytochrome c553